MKIIYHHRTMGRGGEGLHIASIVKNLRHLGHYVVVMSPPGVDPMDRESYKPVDKTVTIESGLSKLWKLISRHFPQWLFELFEFGYNLWVIPRLYVKIRNDVDLVYERYAFFLWAGLLICRIKHIPFFLEVNEVSGLKRARSQSFINFTTAIERLVFKRADAIFTVSSKLREEIIKRGVFSDRIFITPNAIDPLRFRYQDNLGERVRADLNLNGLKVLGFIGWFDYWDNLSELVERFAEVHSRQPGTCLLLIGDGPDVGAVKQKAVSLGLNHAVILPGPVESHEAPAYIDAMDICLIPDSNVFGSPIVLFEYMAMAKPIMAPDLPPIRDVISHGKNGIIFKNLKDDSFREGLTELLSNSALRKQIGRAAYECVMKNHTWAANARYIIDAYRRIVDGCI